MKLSKRLQLIADVIDKYKQGTILADIGSDHGYLPCYLVGENIISYAYACDVAQGPLDSSISNIKHHGLDNKITALLGSGLDPIVDKDVDMISIAGMGAYLIVDILSDHYDYLQNINVMFLQPNANPDHLRKYLFDHRFQIIDEQMVKDGGHIYEVMVVVKDTNKDVIYSDNDIEFGPVLSSSQPGLFKEKWEKQYNVYKNIINTLDHNHPRYIELNQKIKMIEEILYERK